MKAWTGTFVLLILAVSQVCSAPTEKPEADGISSAGAASVKEHGDGTDSQLTTMPLIPDAQGNSGDRARARKSNYREYRDRPFNAGNIKPAQTGVGKLLQFSEFTNGLYGTPIG